MMHELTEDLGFFSLRSERHAQGQGAYDWILGHPEMWVYVCITPAPESY